MRIRTCYKCDNCGWRAELVYAPEQFREALAIIEEEHSRLQTICKELVVRVVYDN